MDAIHVKHLCREPTSTTPRTLSPPTERTLVDHLPGGRLTTVSCETEGDGVTAGSQPWPSSGMRAWTLRGKLA